MTGKFDKAADATRPVTLSYENNRFVLHHVFDEKRRRNLRINAYWQSGDLATFTTDDLGAALVFRKYADEKVRRIFQRRLNEFYRIPETIVAGLDEHQQAGLNWVLSRKRSYLAHAPGAGKTAEAILAACLASGPGQTLFIVPPSLVRNWEREISKFSSWVLRPDEFPTIGVIGSSENRNDVAWRADFIVLPDSMITKDWVYDRISRIRWKLIAVDEASRFKEPTAQRSLAFYGGSDGKSYYCGIYRNARHVVFLDGSPMPNRPIELWAPTYALDPEAIDCMNRDDFGYRYCGARPNERGVWEYLFSSNEEELQKKLRKSFMHVVTEEELSHPERRRSMVFLNEDVRTFEHREWERKNISRITEFTEDVSQGDIARFRRELGIRKVPLVAKYVRERLEEKNESILLFAWHREVVFELVAKLSKYNPSPIIGGTTADAREKAIAAFQAGEKRLLILNIAAAGRGHNLQRADRAVFAEWSWTDELNRQCEKRASRKGSEKLYVKCDYLVCPNSLDERVLSSNFTKERRVKRIIG